MKCPNQPLREHECLHHTYSSRLPAMLHEVLLALSGHPSPLFDDDNDHHHPPGSSPQDKNLIEFPLLSPAERALLRSIGRLSTRHRRLRAHLDAIVSAHASIVCRAVAAAIQNIHLARFQQRILDVEARILSRDASLVGAYDIVPLAAVVGAFDDWHRRMAWYCDLAAFMAPPDGATAAAPCTSALLIDKLRIEAQTGFPDIEDAAVELSRVAENAWLRQLTSWIVFGKIPAFWRSDFFIYAREGEEKLFEKRRDLVPSFVASATADAILMIGKSIHQVQRHRDAHQLSPHRAKHGRQ
ncbi:hypothetical protein MRB53_040784 [Persea americana]|nr:hypothetical protein MRB53_040784 [Persea americana]